MNRKRGDIGPKHTKYFVLIYVALSSAMMGIFRLDVGVWYLVLALVLVSALVLALVVVLVDAVVRVRFWSLGHVHNMQKRKCIQNSNSQISSVVPSLWSLSW